MKSFQNKSWHVRTDYSDEDISFIREHIGCSFLMAKVLFNRFGSDIEEIRSFLAPSLSQLQNPCLMKDFKKAADRILLAIEREEKICIYGDFDMDGLTATALLYEVLLNLGAKVDTYIPDRIDEGYGIHKQALSRIVSNGVSLLISVDCGIKAVDEVAFLKESQVDCIITDHHEKGVELPSAFAVLNPKLVDSDVSLRDLSCVGVAFKLAHGVLMQWKEANHVRHEFDLRRSLDFVAMGTIADVVPLTGENRILVKTGLAVLNKSGRTGLQYVMERAKIKSTLNTYHVAFLLAPRFNAAGRLGKAEEAFRLLITQDSKEADELSLKLDDYNEKRRKIEGQILEEAEEKLKKRAGDRIVVIEDKNWHTGIIGIVASRLSERWKRPVLLIGSEREKRRGSGRSYGDFNLIEALEHVGDIFESYGGHKAACGFSIKQENVRELCKRLNQYADACSKEVFHAKLNISSLVDDDELNATTFEELKALEPYGYGNTRPAFLLKGCKLTSKPRIFKEKHVSFKLSANDKILSAVWYNGYEYLKANDELQVNTKVDVVFQLDMDNYHTPPKVSLKIEDMAFAEEK